MTPRLKLMRTASRLLVLAGALAVGSALYTYASAKVYQVREHDRLRSGGVAFSTPENAVHRVISEGSAIGELRIDRLGVSVVIAEGDSDPVLDRAVGHLRDTPLPGDPGNVVIAGHRDTFFRPLRKIQAGDIISIVTPGAQFTYRVQWTRVVPPSSIDVLAPTIEDTLTLVTCYPFEFIGRAPTRFVVSATISR